MAWISRWISNRRITPNVSASFLNTLDLGKPRFYWLQEPNVTIDGLMKFSEAVGIGPMG